MTAIEMEDVLVLRSRSREGNFRFWLAELSKAEARRWEEKLTRQAVMAEVELGGTFGDPLTLTQVMDKLQARDYRVLDVPSPLN